MDYDQECELIRKENEEYLKLFEEYLTTHNLTDKTIRRHISNVDFYINDFLLYYDAQHMETGTSKLDSFLGDFFIRKCAWSTPESIKTTAASIKKFYKCMLEHEKIEKESYEELCDNIKEGMEFWQEECESYNDF